MSVIPTTIETTADPGAVFSQTLRVRNISSERKEYFIYKRNIIGVEEGGTPVFGDADAPPTGYELADWIELATESITLEPDEEREIPLLIRVPADASPGSHFGAVMLSVEPPRLREIGAGVGYEVASIVSIRISGDVIDTARIRSFSSDEIFYSKKDVTFTARIENQGNILIRPRGPLTISSTFSGREVTLPVNDAQAGIFPRSARDLIIDWDDASVGFGRYEAVLALTYEGNGGQKTIDAITTFWIIPPKVVGAVIGLIVIIIAGGYLFTRFYVRHSLMKAAGGRRIPPQRYRKQVGISRFSFVVVSLLTVSLLFLIGLLILFA
jgi:hypothetical protein